MRASVIIPTYNRREVLLRGLAALQKQTASLSDFEVIVVSDGSTDGTAEAVAALGPPLTVRFIEQQNQGPSVARNCGAREATADLLIYMDDDIEPCPEFVQRHLAAHEENPKLVLIGPQCGPTDEPMPVWIAWEHRMLRRQYKNFVNGVWEAGPNNLYSGNFSAPRAALLAAGGFDERFKRQEDVELGFRLAKQGLSFRFCMEAAGTHRPTRTFESWYNTPYQYGCRDVEMARDLGEARAMELARKHYSERSRVTRMLATLCIGRPSVQRAVLAAGCAGIRRGGALGGACCSIVFNLRYLQGMCESLGGRAQLWHAIAERQPSR